MIFFNFIAINYLRYFFIVLIALEFFYVGIDFISNVNRLPTSANLQIIYIVNSSAFALNYTLPMSIIISTIVTLMSLVKKSEFLALCTIGYSKKDLCHVIFSISTLITLIFIGLNFTQFAYSKDVVDNILKDGKIHNSKEDFFVKHSNYYIYFEKLYPLLQRAEFIRVFEIEDENIKRIIQANIAEYRDDHWVLMKPNIIEKPKDLELGGEGLSVISKDEMVLLKGFKPKILDNIYEARGVLSITDALNSIFLLSQEGVNTNKIRALLYLLVLFPLLAPIFIVFAIQATPFIGRYQNLSILAFKGVALALAIWGVLFALSKLAVSGLILPEISILAPFVVVLAFGFFVYSKL